MIHIFTWNRNWKLSATWRRGLSLGRKLPMVFPYTSQVEKWISRLLFSEQYLTCQSNKSTSKKPTSTTNNKLTNRKIENNYILSNKITECMHTYHRKRVNKIAIDRIQRTRVVIRRSTDRRKIYRLHHQTVNPKFTIMYRNAAALCINPRDYKTRNARGRNDV